MSVDKNKIKSLAGRMNKASDAELFTKGYASGGRKRNTSMKGGEGYTGGGSSGERNLFIDEVPGYAHTDAVRRIIAVENSKDNPNGGYDKFTGRWYPHGSYEGGADTIGYGVKLSNGTPEAELAKRQGYLTDEQAVRAVDSLVDRYDASARRKYDKINGVGAYDSLGEKARGIVIDYEYNPGIQKFPSLMKAFHNEDYKGIRDNYKRYSGGKPLGRNKHLLKDIDSLGVYYMIHPESDGGDIHIKKSKRGTFTAAAKRHGKSVQAFASQVLANKDNYSPAMVKKANFARNAAKWHSDGGAINKAFDEGNLDLLRAAVNNVLSRKISGK